MSNLHITFIRVYLFHRNPITGVDYVKTKIGIKNIKNQITLGTPFKPKHSKWNNPI